MNHHRALLNNSVIGNKSLYETIVALGLSANLKICLDAGDANSYNPALQTAKWLDTSGNGYDFYRGSSTSGDAAEPTFNGTAGGLSSNEYFSFDGGDYLLYDTTNEAWMQNLHKEDAIFSYIAVYYPSASSVVHRIFSSRLANQTGFIVTQQTTGIVQSIGGNGSVNTAVTNTINSVVGAAWNIIGASFNDNETTDNAASIINGAARLETTDYSAPSSSNISGFAIGSFASAGSPNPSGSRLACLAIWQGIALTSNNLTDLHNAIKGRFNL